MGWAGSVDSFFFFSLYSFLFSFITFNFELQFQPNKFWKFCKDVLCHYGLLVLFLDKIKYKIPLSLYIALYWVFEEFEIIFWNYSFKFKCRVLKLWHDGMKTSTSKIFYFKFFFLNFWIILLEFWNFISRFTTSHFIIDTQKYLNDSITTHERSWPRLRLDFQKSIQNSKRIIPKFKKNNSKIQNFGIWCFHFIMS